MKKGFASATACAMVMACSVGVGAESEAVSSIGRYCSASWRQARVANQDWDDCTQQVFLDLLDRLSRDRLATAVEHSESPERRELNRAIWRTASRWRRTRTGYPLSQADVTDFRQARVDATQNARETIEDAMPDVTPRQKEILSHCLDGATVAQIAAALNTPASRISDDKYKAIQTIRRRTD